MIEHNPTWQTTIHNDARKFGHIDEFANIAHSLGYEYISWNDIIYQVWPDNGGFIWTASTTLHRKDVK